MKYDPIEKLNTSLRCSKWIFFFSSSPCVLCSQTRTHFSIFPRSPLQAHVRVWNHEDLKTVRVLGLGIIQHSVACVAFSPSDASILVCVCVVYVCAVSERE